MLLRHFFIFFKKVGQRYSIRYRHLRSQMRNHTHNVMFFGSEMKRPVPPFGKAGNFSLELGKQPAERNTSPCKNTQVSVHGKYVLVVFQGAYTSYGNRFLTNSGKPFADLILPKEDKHLFFYHPWFQKLLVKV